MQRPGVDGRHLLRIMLHLSFLYFLIKRISIQGIRCHYSVFERYTPKEAEPKQCKPMVHNSREKGLVKTSTEEQIMKIRYASPFFFEISFLFKSKACYFG